MWNYCDITWAPLFSKLRRRSLHVLCRQCIYGWHHKQSSLFVTHETDTCHPTIDSMATNQFSQSMKVNIKSAIDFHKMIIPCSQMIILQGFVSGMPLVCKCKGLSVLSSALFFAFRCSWDNNTSIIAQFDPTVKAVNSKCSLLNIQKMQIRKLFRELITDIAWYLQVQKFEI